VLLDALPGDGRGLPALPAQVLDPIPADAVRQIELDLAVDEKHGPRVQIQFLFCWIPNQGSMNINSCNNPIGARPRKSARLDQRPVP